MKKIFILILFATVSLIAQNNNFRIGFGLNASFLGATSNGYDKVKVKISAPIPMPFPNLRIRYNIDSTYSLSSTLGYIIPLSSYNGLEYGISGEYLFKNNFYTTLGYFQHNNGKIKDEGGVAVNIPFIDVGVGYQVFKNFVIEAVYFYPLKRAAFWNGSTNAPYEENPKYIKKIESMVNINFIFTWGIL